MNSMTAVRIRIGSSRRSGRIRSEKQPITSPDTTDPTAAAALMMPVQNAARRIPMSCSISIGLQGYSKLNAIPDRRVSSISSHTPIVNAGRTEGNGGNVWPAESKDPAVLPEVCPPYFFSGITPDLRSVQSVPSPA